MDCSVAGCILRLLRDASLSALVHLLTYPITLFLYDCIQPQAVAVDSTNGERSWVSHMILVDSGETLINRNPSSPKTRALRPQHLPQIYENSSRHPFTLVLKRTLPANDFLRFVMIWITRASPLLLPVIRSPRNLRSTEIGCWLFFKIAEVSGERFGGEAVEGHTTTDRN